MRKRLIDRLYVGDMRDCEAAGTDWFVVHACKQPCYCQKCGDKPDPNSPNYLSFQDGSHLYLNMIGGDAPLYYRRTFDDFLLFMQRAHSSKRPILIHCNKGNSRAPVLALLFLAKHLRKLPNDSFDDAWDAFEELAGEEFAPALGIETWLRANWHEFKQTEEFAPPVAAKPAERSGYLAKLQKLLEDAGDNNEEVAEIIRTQPLLHFAVFTQIQGKSHRYFRPKPNQLQVDIAEAYNWCIVNGIPPRLLVLKPRQVGCSTFCVQLCYHHQRRFPSNSLLMADINSRTVKIWRMFQSIIDHDEFPWTSEVAKNNTEKVEFRYPDGEPGLTEQGTALDANSGIAGTRQVILFSEAGKYKRLNGHDAKLLGSATNSVPQATDNPYTLIIIESTAEGSDGAYYEHWQKAVTLEERKRGEVGNGYIKVFAAWHEFAEHKLPNKPDHAEYFSDDEDERERRGKAIYGWTPEQIAWRRMKIANDCQGDPKVFDQEFPESPSSAFTASGRLRFNIDSLTTMEIRAREQHGLAKIGVLEGGEGNPVMFRQTQEDSWLWMAEEPAMGRSYVGFTDCCTGEQATGSAYPDAHACGILRAAYVDNGKVIPARLAAIIDVPNGCRWDPEILAERAKLLCDYYGGPQFTVEVTGQGLAVVNEFRRKEIPLYEREKQEDLYSGKKTRLAGWDTTSKTRPILVSEMANYIRELALDCTYLPAIEEMKSFIVTSNGRAEAKNGCHDDLVMGISLGLATIELAQAFLPKRHGFDTPTGRFEGSNPIVGVAVGAIS